MELKEVIEAAAKPKISIIMQSYLGNYPGSRKDSHSKFLRAVQSFQNQLYKNCELIIVADNCLETKSLYDAHFQTEDSIRLIYVSRNSKEMSTYMQNEEGSKYYRGFPRRVGVGAATGSLITYMDSDDMLLEEHTLHLMIEFNKNPDANWWINRSWYDNEVMKFKDDKTFEDSTVIARSHADYIYEQINPYGLTLDIEVEAKSKDLAVLKYREQYNTLLEKYIPLEHERLQEL